MGAKRRLDALLAERVRQFDAATRDEARHLVDGDLHVACHELTGLGGAVACGADPHFAREHRRRGTRARLKQSALGEQRVESPLRAHRRAALPASRPS